MTLPLSFLLMSILAALLASGCTSAKGQATAGVEAEKATLNVVTTIAPITSIVEDIGGTKVRITGLVPEGVNSHTFEPAPSAAAALAEADVLIANGLFLETRTVELAKASMRPGTTVLELGEKAISRSEWRFDFSFPEDGGHPNPHLWPDPILSLEYAMLIAEELSRLEPPNASYFAANYAAFKQRIDSLDAAIVTAIATIPPQNRVLLTYHDSWAYFASRYGMTVIGAVQPSDFSEPSAREVADLIDQIRDRRLPAIFGSEVFPSGVMEQIARETGATFVDNLRDDDLPGAPGDPDHSYLGMMVLNVETIVEALGGDASVVSAVSKGPGLSGAPRAVYPQ